MPAAPPCSVASPAATSGPAVKRIAHRADLQVLRHRLRRDRRTWRREFASAPELADAVLAKWPETMVATAWSCVPAANRCSNSMKSSSQRYTIATSTSRSKRMGHSRHRRYRLALCQPQARSRLLLTKGDELKLVYPQSDGNPAEYEKLDFGTIQAPTTRRREPPGQYYLPRCRIASRIPSGS